MALALRVWTGSLKEGRERDFQKSKEPEEKASIMQYMGHASDSLPVVKL